MELLSCKLHHSHFLSCSQRERKYYIATISGLSPPWLRKQPAGRQDRPKIYFLKKVTTDTRTLQLPVFITSKRT
jgi:hypothetical protein